MCGSCRGTWLPESPRRLCSRQGDRELPRASRGRRRLRAQPLVKDPPAIPGNAVNRIEFPPLKPARSTGAAANRGPCGQAAPVEHDQNLSGPLQLITTTQAS